MKPEDSDSFQTFLSIQLEVGHIVALDDAVEPRSELAVVSIFRFCSMYLSKCLRGPRLLWHYSLPLMPGKNLSSSNRQSVSTVPLNSVLIANRGEIALLVASISNNSIILTSSRRVARTASQYGIRTTTIYTDPDAKSQHALSSPFAINLGDPKAYLDGDRIIKVAKEYGCDSIHPGYGFVCAFYIN